MKRIIALAAFGSGLLCAAAHADTTVTVDPTAAWIGFMNVFELPENGGGYVFGSVWGTADLKANFSGPTLTLQACFVNDPSAFWFNPAPGGPGVPGNKTMDANMYVEPAPGTYVGQTLTFNGSVLSNSLISPYTSVAFIKDFVSDFSSSVSATVPLNSGPFSVSLLTSSDPTHHIQYGFETIGPNAWSTDIDAKGSVQVTATTPLKIGDYNQNGIVDAADYTVWRDHLGQSFALANRDPGNSGAINASDYTSWKSHFGNSGSGASISGAVPEPSSMGLAILATILLGLNCRRGR
jgi:hypothetical protein